MPKLPQHREELCEFLDKIGGFNTLLNGECNHIMVDTGKYERECKFCKLTELRAK